MQQKWFRLDTAALIFPAIMNRRWSNAFRVSALLTEEIDPTLLQQAVDELKPRFPNFYTRLSKGIFWYRLEEAQQTPRVQQDYAYPLVHMSYRALHTNCVRVMFFKNRIAVECFHSVTDGTGGMLFLQNLVRHYVQLRYGITCPDTEKLLCPSDAPLLEELEDSFFKNSSGYACTAKEEKVYKLPGQRPGMGFRHLVCGSMPSDLLVETAHRYHCSVTSFLSAVMALSVIRLQNDNVPRKKQKPVKIAIPVNLRRLYESRTFRNFALVLNLGVDPRQGEYSLQDVCSVISHELKAKATPQYMAGMIAQNTLPQQVLAIRLVPLPIKSMIMRMVYNVRGENSSCLNVSNLGTETLPAPLAEKVERLDFIIGTQKSYPNNCSVVSYKNTTRINMIRSTPEATLEKYFFSSLVELGIPVDIESNEVQ